MWNGQGFYMRICKYSGLQRLIQLIWLPFWGSKILVYPWDWDFQILDLFIWIDHCLIFHICSVYLISLQLSVIWVNFVDIMWCKHSVVLWAALIHSFILSSYASSHIVFMNFCQAICKLNLLTTFPVSDSISWLLSKHFFYRCHSIYIFQYMYTVTKCMDSTLMNCIIMLKLTTPLWWFL